MARGGTGVFIIDTIGPALAYMVGSTAVRVAGAMEEGKVKLENYAKANAPWSDITGQARAGLTADVFEDGGDIVIELYHTVEHGWWLELIQDGRFGIILPTLEALGPEILAEAGAEVINIRGAG
jgi:hypothetical protein